jgi:hypothetical protein
MRQHGAKIREKGGGRRAAAAARIKAKYLQSGTA